MEHHDVIVLGGGAAGLFAASIAGRRGKKVLLLEHNDRPGKKIVISGGGRCNFTNLRASPENYLSHNPEFCRSALARYRPEDFLDLVQAHRIRWHEKKLGQLFCDGSSREIVQMLLAECAAAGVSVRCGVRAGEVTKPGRFRLGASCGALSCDALIVATGGLSFAKLGASGAGYDIARQFGLRVTTTRPGLVPLTLSGAELASYGPLSGVSLPVRARCGGAVFQEDMLVTHRGFSGPAILQISSYWRKGDAVSIDLLPGRQNAIAPGGGAAAAQLGSLMPRRFADVWCGKNAPAKAPAQWSSKERRDFDEHLHAWPVAFSGTEGYPKAEVTLGGVDTRELSSKTMEARSVPGLYFVGEVMDVTGWLGGYNFQWAWASASAAGNAV